MMQVMTELEVQVHIRKVNGWWSDLPRSLKWKIYQHYKGLEDSHSLSLDGERDTTAFKTDEEF